MMVFTIVPLLCAQVIRDRKKVLEEQIKNGATLKTAVGGQYLDFLDILLTSKVDIVSLHT